MENIIRQEQKKQGTRSKKYDVDRVIEEYKKEFDDPNAEIIRNYCYMKRIKDIHDFSDGYILDFMFAYIPGVYSIIPEKKIRDLCTTFFQLTGFVIKKVKIKDSLQMYYNYYKIYSTNMSTLLRIAKLKKAIFHFLEEPLLKLDPMIVSLANYKKKFNSKELTVERYLLEYGYYEVMEIFKGLLVLKDLKNEKNLIRISLPYGVTNLVKEGDIFQLVLKKNLFILYWDIKTVKNCYPASIAKNIMGREIYEGSSN